MGLRSLLIFSFEVDVLFNGEAKLWISSVPKMPSLIYSEGPFAMVGLNRASYDLLFMSFSESDE